ncbi:G-type lectin S-receptor-like serine/threonine-protein kinase At4g27290 [Linum perenne]
MLISSIPTSTTSLLVDSISPGQFIKDGETLVSSGQSFELGFFGPGTSNSRYLGIWYKNIASGTVVWVANRETPILDGSGLLKLTPQGILLLFQNTTNRLVWSSPNVTHQLVKNQPAAQLLDSGNFVVKDRGNSNPDGYLYQSFDYPTDTILPGMKLGRNLVTGMDWSITSWKSLDDPAKGEYSLGIDPTGYPQMLVRQGNATIFRGGSWNGIRFTGTRRQQKNSVWVYEFVFNEREVSLQSSLVNKSVPSRLVVNASGATGRLYWKDNKQGWVVYYMMGADQCDQYAKCGVNARCDIDGSRYCNCLDGFRPKSPVDWNVQDWSSGCTTTTPLKCSKGEGFVRFEQMKLPDTSWSWFDKNMTLHDCKKECLKKCSCTAYTSLNVSGDGSGCLIWFGDLVDLRGFAETGQDLYVRVSASYIGEISFVFDEFENTLQGLVITVIVLGWSLCFREMKRRIQGKKKSKLGKDYNNDDLELPIFDFNTIMNATNNFCLDYKLGEGGFGPVYKGILFDGQEIAVKRLSISSGQGMEEFKNEVVLISKLQHRNLVRLLGCCIEGEEKMLIYEYMPNKSLDYFIFDESRSRLLDWARRINIIEGIARGLLYLHQDSRLRIIHRDLKASNVLLDNHLNPKISDFGMARMFGGDQTEDSTNRVVGTFGYMAPEYAIDGLFSMTSDIFSFGVLVLEVLTGKKNRGFFTMDHGLNLIGHAWKLWMEEKPLEVVREEHRAETIGIEDVVKRHIQVGLLCVQQEPEDRPTMSSVVLMLGSESVLPDPRPPGFFAERKLPDMECSSGYYCKSRSISEITATELLPR